MKKLFICTISVLISISVYAQEDIKFKGWKKASTDHFTFIYEDSCRETTEAYAKIADEAWNKIAKIYSFPKNHMDIYVTDRTNTVNAFTFFSPTEIGMFTTPPTINDFGFRANWRELFFTHELIHAANIIFEDKSEIPSLLFGSLYKSFDFFYVPGWALEGLTTVLESELTAGGRGRSPYFELEYKAPTLENSLISYSQIGLEQEPPQGQSYIMGYLIMRSIADRWGIQALADIERNRNLTFTWEQSVKLVTGYTPEEIYRDAKIALAKKYAKEREIPDGITISPRTVNTNYYKPAIVFDDGSLIAMRTAKNKNAAVVRLNPALRTGSNYIDYTNPEKDLNSIFNETVLFEGVFPEINCVTADENGTIYASMGIQTKHKQPGVNLEYAIYKWTEEKGLKRLTKSGTYLQPSVSRDGKTLVALRQYGLTFALVKIDLNTGAESILLKDTKLDFIQPAVNDDGSKVAFMTADGTRARICVLNLNERNSQYEVIYNDSEEITDPSAPSWNGSSLTFIDNRRGRLESFEVNSGKITPVVADPAGILWAYKNDMGIFYSTFSATGYVLKIKPTSEYGNVPDYNGPSMPGDIICFGSLENDYPDFQPYEKLHEVEAPAKTFKELLAEEKNRNKDEPISIRGKTVKHRQEDSIARLDSLAAPKTTLSEEKLYIPFPKPVLSLPLVSFVEDNENSYFGFGGAIISTTPKLQMSYGITSLDFIYYPEINNFMANLDIFAPLGAGTFELFVDRILRTNSRDDIKYFCEHNSFDLGYKHPIYVADTFREKTSLNAMMNVHFAANSMDSLSFSAFTRNDYTFDLSCIAGIELITGKNHAGRRNVISTDIFEINLYNFNMSRWFAGVESEINLSHSYNAKNIVVDADAKIRYTDFPVDTEVPNSLLRFNGKKLDCSYPGRTVFQIGGLLDNILGTGLGFKIYEETLLSFGKNSVDYKTPDSGNFMNFTFHNQYATGLEVGVKNDETKIAFGYSFLTDFTMKSFVSGNFYFTIKIDWIRL